MDRDARSATSVDGSDNVRGRIRVSDSHSVSDRYSGGGRNSDSVS